MTVISPQGSRPASASALPYEALCDVDTASIRYRVEGPEDAPTLVLSNSLGTSMWMWDAQMPSFSRNFRVLRYDSRGHGGSSAPVGPYTIERLARDVIGLLDALNMRRVHFCGLSLGGLVGMWLGVHASERIDRLVLCNTAPRIGTAATWNARIAAVRDGGLQAIAEAGMERWFTPGFRQRAPEVVERMRAMLCANDCEGYASSCAAVRDIDLWQDIGGIDRPTLVVSGAHDTVTTTAEGAKMAEVMRARHVDLDASHISNVEAPQQFTAHVEEFLGQRPQALRSTHG